MIARLSQSNDFKEREFRMRKQPRRRKFRPVTEVLEPRITMSAEVGINLNFNASYNGDPIWTDLHNLSTNWSPLTGSKLALTADGYPLANALVYFNTANYAEGTYGFSYTGTGTVSFSGVAQSMGPVTVSGGVTTGTVVVNQALGNNDNLIMQVVGINPADPMDNFHLMAPGYGNGTTQEPMFMPAFLNALQPFSDIRFLNWDVANDSTVANWSSRVQPNAYVVDSAAGVPYEDMIELCNEAQKDMWINVPALATPQFIQSLSQLIHQDLDPNLNVYVEYSNETWNSGFTAYSQILSAAKANPLVTQSSNGSMMVAQQSAYEEILIAKTFDTTFGAESSRVRPILAGQESYTQIATWEFQFIQQNYGAPNQYIWAYAATSYIAIPSADNVAGLTLNQLFADLDQYITGAFTELVQANAAIASEYGLPYVSYEGGNFMVPGANDLNLPVMIAAQNDPRMYQAYTMMFNAWTQNGGSLFNDFTLDGIPSQYGIWGALLNVVSPGSQEYDAMVSETEPPGDANLDEIVDYADFQTLAANYGDTGRYWEQGDFNDDGTVNWQDLNILRQNLNPAGFSLSQFAQTALFGQLSTVVPGQSLEYDGYGVTYASSMPFTASSGTVKLNENSQGNAIVLGGATYSEGLGVLANSSVSLALNGQYTRFESTIGVDGTSNTGSSVIFNVYGDGQLLYQSPTLTYSSGGIPIDLSVAGVTTLTITVSAAPGSNPLTDNAVWADARLVSTANFGSVTPDTLTWQLSQNGTVISTQTTDSFVFAAMSGTYTLALTVTDAQGEEAMASTTVVVTPAVASAAFVMLDSHTQGNWVGTYGSQGYDLVNDAASLPAYATVTTSGATAYTWNSDTNAVQALTNPSDSLGLAAAWYSDTTFTVDVNLTDGQTHDLTLYAVDFASQNLNEQIQIVNATTGAVLDTKTLWSFTGGVYLQWAVSGNILIEVTKISGLDAVLSGLFFDPPSASVAPAGSAAFVQSNTTTEGGWLGEYGTQGYDVIGATASFPDYATVTPSGESSATWAATTTDPRALQLANGTGRIAAYWYSSTSFTVDVNLTDGKAHELELYFLDWDNAGRSERVTISNAVTGSVLSTETVSSFTSGVYLQWAVTGNVLITITNVAGPNAVLSGIFLDPPATLAAFIKKDTATEGNWIGTYGTQGYDIIDDTASIPSYATVTASGESTYIWGGTTQTQVLETADGTSRIAAAWYAATSFTVDVNLTDGQVHDLELYLLDWQSGGRVESVKISNATTGAVLDTETVSSFSNGVYLDWAVSGNILITFTCVVGNSSVLSGLFLDPSTTVLTTPVASATFVKQDTATEGTWIGTYGTQGYDIIGATASLPSYATVAASGESSYTWTASTTDPRALETAGGTSRIAAVWYSATTFTVDVNLTDGQVHDLELYFLDWDNSGRSESVTISNATTGVVLSTETVSSFYKGVYLEWAVSGNVLITITHIAGNNAVLNGLFLDPMTTSNDVIVTSTAAKDNVATISGTSGSYGFGPLNLADSDPQAVLPAGVTASGSFALMPAPTVTLSIGKTTKRIRIGQRLLDEPPALELGPEMA
jgi:hypothetical protein